LKYKTPKPLQIKAFLKNLPGSNAKQTGLDQITRFIEEFHPLDDLKGSFLLRDHVDFMGVNGAKGRKQILSPEEGIAARKRQRRYREPKTPFIQTLLKLAYTLKVRLNKSPGLTRDALAKQVRINPSYLTRMLNLLNLAPGIQQHILSMPPETNRGPLTECRMKFIARMTNHKDQLQAFNELLKTPARAKKYKASNAVPAFAVPS
jgi:AraC-like DNA-binding protein